jgi:hypothetical protein
LFGLRMMSVRFNSTKRVPQNVFEIWLSVSLGATGFASALRAKALQSIAFSDSPTLQS